MLFHYFMMLLAHGHKTYTIRSGFSCYWETASKHRSELEFACGLRCCVSNVFLIFFAHWEMFTLLQGSTNVFLFAEDNLVYVSFTLLFLINNFFFRTKVFGHLQSLNLELSKPANVVIVDWLEFHFPNYGYTNVNFLSILRTCTTRTSRTSVEGGLRSNSKAWGMVAC